MAAMILMQPLLFLFLALTSLELAATFDFKTFFT